MIGLEPGNQPKISERNVKDHASHIISKTPRRNRNNHNPMNLNNILKMDREKGNKSLKYFQLPQL
jgi:hypothetical protein